MVTPQIRGVIYDAGTVFGRGQRITRRHLDERVMRRELEVIRDELHATHVRVVASDPDRLDPVAAAVAEAGLGLPPDQRPASTPPRGARPRPPTTATPDPASEQVGGSDRQEHVRSPSLEAPRDPPTFPSADRTIPSAPQRRRGSVGPIGFGV
jgi:hypothetical protein